MLDLQLKRTFHVSFEVRGVRAGMKKINQNFRLRISEYLSKHLSDQVLLFDRANSLFFIGMKAFVIYSLE